MLVAFDRVFSTNSIICANKEKILTVSNSKFRKLANFSVGAVSQFNPEKWPSFFLLHTTLGCFEKVPFSKVCRINKNMYLDDIEKKIIMYSVYS